MLLPIIDVISSYLDLNGSLEPPLDSFGGDLANNSGISRICDTVENVVLDLVDNENGMCLNALSVPCATLQGSAGDVFWYGILCHFS